MNTLKYDKTKIMTKGMKYTNSLIIVNFLFSFGKWKIKERKNPAISGATEKLIFTKSLLIFIGKL